MVLHLFPSVANQPGLSPAETGQGRAECLMDGGQKVQLAVTVAQNSTGSPRG